MKRALIILLSVFLYTGINGQILPGVISSSKLGETGFCTEYQAVYNAMTTKPTASVATRQNTLVLNLIAAGIWAKADAIYVFAVETNDNGEALINWKNPGTLNATISGSVTHTSLEGVDGGASGTIIAFNPYSVTGNYTQNSAAISMYFREDLSEDRQVCGIYSGGAYMEIIPWSTSNTMVSYFNAGTSNNTAVSSSLGLITVSRTSSTAVEFYSQGTSLAEFSKTSSTLLNANIILLGRTTTSSTKSNNQLSYTSICSGLTDAEVAAENAAVETYMDGNGKGVEG